MASNGSSAEIRLAPHLQVTQLAVAADHLTFTFTRNDTSEEDTSLLLQWSDSLGVWNDVPIDLGKLGSG